jgi:hypothetical protein
MRFFSKRRESEQPGRPPLDRHEAAWVSTNRRPFDTFSVGSLVPVVFDRYARVLHPASSYGNAPVRWSQVADWSGRTSHGLAQWDLLSKPSQPVTSPSPFLLPPRLGGLPRHELRALCDLLARYTATPQSSLVALWEGYGLGVPLIAGGKSVVESRPLTDAEAPWASGRRLELENRTFIVVELPVQAAADMGGGDGARAHQPPPTLIWAADHSWFVGCDPDLDSTYVGGSAELIAAILATPDFEAWPAEPTDDVSIGSDEINLDPSQVIPPGQLSWFDSSGRET